MREFNDFRPETRSLLAALVAAGFTIRSGDNGEDRFKFTGDMEDFIANLVACDETMLYVTTPKGKTRWLSLVFGNSPGELVSNYLLDDAIDKITDAHYRHWQDKPQPKTVEL